MLALTATLVPGAALHAMPRQRRIAALLPRESCAEAMKEIRPALGSALARLGHDVVFESHCFGSDFARAELLAREIVRAKPDVIVVEGTHATRLVLARTTTIPVMAVLANPVASGLARDLARPERNLTGFSNSRPGSEGKVVELARLAAPRLSRLILVSEASYPESALHIEPYVVAAKVAGMPAEVRLVDTAGLDALFRTLRRDELAFLQWGNVDKDRTAAMALSHRAATMLNTNGYVERGGFMSYSVHVVDVVSKQAALLDKLLRGIAPADIPWELPDRSHVGLNLRTAKILGLSIAPDLLLRADKVVE
jgi:putative ABC transport system substrate-binding protein